MIMWVISAVMALVFGLGIGGMVTAPNVGMTHQTPDISTADNSEYRWVEFHVDAYVSAEDEFTALFGGYETRWSKNGRLMLRQGSTGPYKFVRRAA